MDIAWFEDLRKEDIGIAGYSVHPDFECDFNGEVEMGIVGPIGTGGLGLDEDLKPIYALGDTGNNPGHPDSDSTHGKEYFDQWYRTTETVNLETTMMLELIHLGSGLYEYDNACFFPIDDYLFGSIKTNKYPSSFNECFIVSAHLFLSGSQISTPSDVNTISYLS